MVKVHAIVRRARRSHTYRKWLNASPPQIFHGSRGTVRGRLWRRNVGWNWQYSVCSNTNVSWKRLFALQNASHSIRPWVFFVFQFLMKLRESNKPIISIEFPSATSCGPYVTITNGYGRGGAVGVYNYSSCANSHKLGPNSESTVHPPLIFHFNHCALHRAMNNWTRSTGIDSTINYRDVTWLHLSWPNLRRYVAYLHNVSSY